MFLHMLCIHFFEWLALSLSSMPLSISNNQISLKMIKFGGDTNQALEEEGESCREWRESQNVFLN